MICRKTGYGVDVTLAANDPHRHLGNDPAALFFLFSLIRGLLVLLGLLVLSSNILLSHRRSEVDRSDQTTVCPIPDLDEAVF